LVHENDELQLIALKNQIDTDFEKELAVGASITTTDIRRNSTHFAPGNMKDGDDATYWSTDDTTTSAAITIAFKEPTEVNRIVLQEYIPLGQRVQKFSVEVEVAGSWIKVADQTTIGYKRILRFDTAKASKVKVNIEAAKGPPCISNLALYRAPNFLVTPKLERDKDGMVTLTVPDDQVAIYYTLDGSTPTKNAAKYTKPFLVEVPTTVKVISIDPEKGKATEPISHDLDVTKKNWKVLSVSSGDVRSAEFVIDENPNTFWATDEKASEPQEIVIDLGQAQNLRGFTYWPIQERYPFGIVTDFEFFISTDAKNWKKIANGEFANIVNSRLEQQIAFSVAKAKYIKLKAVKVYGDDFRASFAEVGVITEE
jgi:alpha-L-fucosidase